MKKLILIGTLLIINTSYALSVVELHPTRILIEHVNKMPERNIQTKSAMCTASANTLTAQADQNITASGYISYSITNDSNIEQYYSIDEYMCINAFGCTHVRDSVKLGAHLTGIGGGDIFTTQYIQYPGTYQDQSSIQIDGESKCYVKGGNTIQIY